MSALLSSPTPSFPSSTAPLHTPTPQEDDSDDNRFELQAPPPPRSPNVAITAPATVSTGDSDARADTGTAVNDNVPALDSTTSSSPPTSGSEPSTPTMSHQPGHHHSSVVPAYPYNVQMAPAHIPGGADDSGITTRLPSICVDYLSHDWQEDDVWASWKAMTKHKTEIANGVRLENASWRTWAKQRGNLKTISPETLNWLKDSDVTWLYGPLHTNVDAVPPPKESTMSDRLGLEALRPLDRKKVRKTSDPRPEIKTKPILKHRSLSDILLPPGSASPVLEDPDAVNEDQGTISIHHARSDSSLVRLNSLNRKKGKRGSPLTSPRSESPERVSDSSSSMSLPYHAPRKEHRHISFNHRVEQCIAVDSSDEGPRRVPSSLANAISRVSSDGDDDDDDDDEDEEVLTFRSSPRAAALGPDKLTSSKPWEPHTIARLDPTTLKSTEVYPAPSPAVVYQNYNNQQQSFGASSSSGPYGGQSSSLYAGGKPDGNSQQSTTTTGTDSQQQQQSHNQQRPRGQPARPGNRRVMYDYTNSAAMRQGGWDPEDEDDYAMGYDFYVGPDVGVGDEYDMAQYGSTHLVGGTHNDFGQPAYPHISLYSPPQYQHVEGGQNNHNYGVQSGSSSSLDSTPNHSRASSGGVPASPASSATAPVAVSTASVRGPYQPASSSRDAAPPKRSILKGSRSREPSSDSPLSASPRSTAVGIAGESLSGNGTPVGAASPAGSVGGPSPSSSPSASPYGSSSSLGSVGRATAIPQHVRPTIGGRRVSSDDGLRERGRSASRGSSSSLDRSGSSDRRSSHSISPSAYSPPSPSLTGGPSTSGSNASSGQRTPTGSRKVSSYDSLSGMAEQAAAAGTSSSSSTAGGSSSNLSTGPVSKSSPTSSASGIARSLSNVTEVSNESDADSALDEHEGKAPPANGLRPVGASIDPRANDEAEAEQIEDVSMPATVPDYETTPGSSGSATPIATPMPHNDESKAMLGVAPAVAKGRPAPVSVSASNVPAAPVSPPLVPAPSPRTATGQQYRQPSPSKATSATTDDDSRLDHGGGVSSLSNSPALDPTDLASAQWSDESVPSYARRSLLRAARQGSASGSGSLHKTSSRDSPVRGVGSSASGGDDGSSTATSGTRTSLDSGRSRSSTDDYGFSLYDDDGSGEAGIMGRTLEVAGTARDLLGAISKSLWGFRGKSGSPK